MRAVVSQRQERCARGTRAKGGARGWPGGNLCHRAESSTVAHAERGHRWSGARWMRLLLLLLLLLLLQAQAQAQARLKRASYAAGACAACWPSALAVAGVAWLDASDEDAASW